MRLLKAHSILFVQFLLLSLSQIALAQNNHSFEPLQQTQGSGSTSLAQAIQAQTDGLSSAHLNHQDMDKVDEHMALLSLFPLASDATVVVALKGGSWFDPSIWSTGQVPSIGDNVYIPYGIVLIYDGVSNDELNIVGVNGELHFSVIANTRMIVDSLLIGPESVLTIGDLHNPLPNSHQAEIIFHRGNGNISSANDPEFLLRGLVSHGAVRIAGHDVTDHLKTSRYPQAQDNYLLFDSSPVGWSQGDKLVVAAAKNRMSKSTHQFVEYQDEVVEISSIVQLANDTTRVNLQQSLLYDHIPPAHSSNAKLGISVANYSRNIFIGTEASASAYMNGGNTVPIAQRGHVMFMHNNDIVVHNAEFFELGRTDKSQFFSATNIPGRYALHFHRIGVDANSVPASVQGNAIWGSPGWGIVHHDSNLNVDSNAVFGAVGSGIVAEAGNETGRWGSNIVIQTTGVVRTFNAEQSADGNGNPVVDHPAYQAEVLNNSFAQGEAFGMKSRLLKITDNIAISANGVGFSFWPHGTSGPAHIGANSKDYELAHGYDPFYGQNSIYPGKVPTRDFFGNEVVASRHALNTSANKIAHRHDMDVIIEDLLSWNVDQAIMSFYQENYIIKDSIFIRGLGNTESGHFYNGVGTGSSATHIHDPVEFKVINNYFEGYDTITKEPFELILGNSVVGSSITTETGPNGQFQEGATADNDSIDILDNSSDWQNNEVFVNPIGYLDAFVSVSESDLVMTEYYDRFSAVVYKSDTLGDKRLEMGSQVSKEFRGASQLTWWQDNAVTDGYYQETDSIFLIVEAVVSDRVTGTIGSIEAAIELEFLDGDPSSLPQGSVNNGSLPSRISESKLGVFKIVDKRAIGQIGNLLTTDNEDTGTDVFGFGFGDNAHKNSYSSSFNLSYETSGALLCVDGYGIDSSKEVSVIFNTTLIGYLAAGSTPTESCFEIPPELLVKGKNTVKFSQSNPGETWGVGGISFQAYKHAIFHPAILMLLD
ncbi:MAG: G8 domain-containing protein [Acidiferrobacterales bacterium]|nr:G8 domain-containing protein [Acidiferrobacterales bacterium]